MSNHSKKHHAKFEAAFEKYLHSYMTLRDSKVLEEMFAADLCGFGTGHDEIAYSKKEGLVKYQRDLASAPNPVRYTLHRREIKLLDPHNAIIICELDLATEIMDQEVKLNNLRLTMVLHEENSVVKIYGMHLSLPTEVHDKDESYPLKELEERTRVLNRLVDEKTASLQQALHERKAAEEELREERAFQAILLDLAAGFINVSPAG